MKNELSRLDDGNSFLIRNSILKTEGVNPE